MISSRFNRFSVILLSFILSLVFLSFSGCSNKKRVATIDGNAITLDYFLSTRNSGFDSKTVSQKNKALDEFYATLLRAKEAQETNLAEQGDLKYKLAGSQQKIILNAFYQSRVVDAVLPESELRNAYEKMKDQRKVSRLLIRYGPGSTPKRTEKEALELAQTIKEQINAGGITFEKAVEQYSDDMSTKKKGGDMGYVSYPQLPPDIQQAIWNLQLNEISDPIKTGVGFFLIKLTEIRPVKLGSYTQEVKRIKDVMMRGRADSLRATWDSLRISINKETETTFNDSTLMLLADRIYKVYSNNYSKGQIEDLGSLIDSIEYVSPGKIEGKTIAPEDMKETLRFAQHNNFRGLTSADLTKRLIRYHLQMAVIANYAENHGIKDYDDIANKLRWDRDKSLGEYYLNNVVLANFPPTEDTLKAFYNREKSTRYATVDTVHVREIYVSDKSAAQEIRDQLKNGADFVSLAKKNTQRPDFQKTGGDLGWFPTDRYGAIGETAKTMTEGETAGPIAVGTGWSVIKLIEKKPGDSLSFDEIKGNVRKDYISKYRPKRIEQNLKTLENKYKSDLNYSALQTNQ